MRIVDLTHYLEAGMPVYPGTESPVLEEANTISRDGFREKKITLYSHTGTHMDAPAHILPGAPTLDGLPPDQFMGTARLADIRGDIRGGRKSRLVGLEELRLAAGLESGGRDSDTGNGGSGNAALPFEFLILRTGWEKIWGAAEYFGNFPVLDEKAARWLAGLGLKGVGLDAISVDPVESHDLPVHRILLGSGMVIVENLANLDSLPYGHEQFRFFCAPLRIRDADGSPVRALAEVPTGCDYGKD
jgi:kynurenine formamidase